MTHPNARKQAPYIAILGNRKMAKGVVHPHPLTAGKEILQAFPTGSVTLQVSRDKS
jgi:hypothetical protein